MYFYSRIASKIELSTPKKHPRFWDKTAIPFQKINPFSLPPDSTNRKIDKITNLQRSRLRPPYSPELNPVERFWLQVKRATIKNKVYETLSQLEDAVCCFLCTISPQDIAKICATSWFNYGTVNNMIFVW